MNSRRRSRVLLVLLSVLASSSLGQADSPLTDGLFAGGVAALETVAKGTPFFNGPADQTDMRGLGPLAGFSSLASQAAAGATNALLGGGAGLLGNVLPQLTNGVLSAQLTPSVAGATSNSAINQNMAGMGAGMASMASQNPFSGLGNPVARHLKRSVAANSFATTAGSDMYAANPMTAAMDAETAFATAPGPNFLGPESAALTAATAAATAPAAAAAALDAAATIPVAAAGNALAAANSLVANNAATAAASGTAAAAELAAASSPVAGRQVLALEAMRNAQTESAMAGSEMAAHGANNARSASLASNAYREAKLASARDRVNIAGTIQNSARISDAAIATHDAATKAEDSLLGSELAVDSAATVLDSDGAYIPPVTNSLLRSLPYGRLGLRNIIPKPLTHPSPGLPDVWLNGYPVSYGNVPLRSLAFPLPFGPTGLAPAGPMGGAFGAFFNQPFTSNNGLVLNGMVFDPAYAYLTTNLNGVVSSSLAPILANGQLEAQDELAVANLLQMQQLNGLGMSTTYQGYGRLNPVPMITGSVTDANLMPTTTIGTTYPIGSTLVIEPRDSFFQDYTDSASSRQNFDERQQ